MRKLTELAHEHCRVVLRSGDVAIDATAGNGHDTLFLAQQVGVDGKVFALDIQEQALQSTTSLLQSYGIGLAELIKASHAILDSAIPSKHHGQIAAVMFNLGYLPGGDKTVITKPKSTLQAVMQATKLLRAGGVMTLLCYTGHAGGTEETEAVRQCLNNLPRKEFATEEIPGCDDPQSPLLFVTKKLANLNDTDIHNI